MTDKEGQTMIDRTYRNDPYEGMSQEPCDYCPYQNTDKCANIEEGASYEENLDEEREKLNRLCGGLGF